MGSGYFMAQVPYMSQNCQNGQFVGSTMNGSTEERGVEHIGECLIRSYYYILSLNKVISPEKR